MNILFIVLNSVGKGTYWRALGFGRSLVQAGHTVTLMATAASRRKGIVEHNVQGVAVVETPDFFRGALRSGWDPWNTAQRIRWLGQRRFDLVHAFESRPTVLFPALFQRYLRQTPLFSDWSDWFGKGGSVEQRPNPLVRGVLRPVETYFETAFRTQARGITVICTELRDKALGLGFDPDATLLLPNGCDTQRFFPQDRYAARRKLALDPNLYYIGYLGSIFRRDAGLMAQAFAYVHQRQPAARLLVIGNTPVECRRYFQSSDAILQTGYVADPLPNDYLAACDLCWLPLHDTNANRGRWPMKINDYLAAGRPIVATAVGDVTALLGQEPAGLLAVDAAEPFAEQTLHLLANPDRRAEYGAHAHHVAATLFDWNRLTGQLLAFYAQNLTAEADAHAVPARG